MAGPLDLDLARKVLRTEAAAILELVDRIGAPFETAVRAVLDCRGRVLVTGMGKSGIICRKIAATLSSTGTPAFFLHPAEALHGDLGAVVGEDVVVALSNSGETEEIVRLLETIKRIGARLVVITGNPASTLGAAADVTLDCRVSEEACPMNLAPTASTTAALALGDALALVVFVAKGFQPEDYADRHPGGRLGRRLMRVEHLMHGGEQRPMVSPATPMADVMVEMSRKGFGMTCVVDDAGRLSGVITDGDLRRHLLAPGADTLMQRPAAEVMTRKPVTIPRTMLAAEALRLMEERKITSIVVTGASGTIEGVVHLHDLWRTHLV